MLWIFGYREGLEDNNKHQTRFSPALISITCFLSKKLTQSSVSKGWAQKMLREILQLVKLIQGQNCKSS